MPVVALLFGAFALAAPARAQSAPVPIQDGQIPSPAFSGHAALYAWGAATLPDGSVAIGDIWNRRVVHFATDGTNLGVLFNIPAGQDPYGLGVDPNTGDIYVGASRCCSVQKWAPSGSTYVQQTPITNSQFKYPGRVQVADNGDVYIADMLVGTIFVYDSSGNFLFSFGSLGSGLGQMHQPRGMAFDGDSPQQHLYVMDAANYRIDVFNLDGSPYMVTPTTNWFGNSQPKPAKGGCQFQGNDTRGIAIDRANGWLYAVDMVAEAVHKFDLSPSDFGGCLIDTIGGGSGLTARNCCSTPAGYFSDGGREDAVDGAGNLWVSDMPNFRVQVFSPSGQPMFVEPNPASNPPTGAFNYPEGVGVDSGGNLVVSDTRNFRLQAFDPTGAFLWQEGIRGQGSYNPYRLNYSRAVAFDPVDNSFVLADTYNNAVKKFSSVSTGGSTLWETGGTAGRGPGHFIRPSGVAVGPDENVYVADSANKRIEILNGSTGAYITQFVPTTSSGADLLNDPRGVAVDPATDNIYVADYVKGAIYEFTNAPNFSLIATITQAGPLSGNHLEQPWSVAVDANYIYVTDTRADLVDVFNKSDGSFATAFGGAGTGPSQLRGPQGLAVAGNGLIYVADTYNDRIVRWCLDSCPVTGSAAASAIPPIRLAASVSTMPQPTPIRTIGANGEAQIYPGGVAVDASGNVYAADTGNDKVSMYPAGSSTPSWSVGVRGEPIGGGTDSFANPRDVAVDASYVYVADTDDGLIQVLNKANGSFVTTFQTKFKSPLGVGVGTDGSGNERILVADGVTGAVSVFNTAYQLVLTIPRTTNNEGTRDAATNSAGDIFTADYRNNRIDEYSPSGTFLAEFGGGLPNTCDKWPRPYGVDVDDAGNVYVASSDYEVITEFNPTDGTCVRTFGTKGTGPGQIDNLFQLRRVAVGRGANPEVYAADLWGLKILTYNQDGTISSTQPVIGNGMYPAAGGLNEARGVAVNSQYVYVTNTNNQRMERFNSDGSSPIDWGIKGTPETSASFNWAQGVALDPTGDVWVANTRNNRIDEFLSGGGQPVRSVGSRTGTTGITFNWPMGLTFDPSGNMYVADTYDNRIKAFAVTPTTVTQLWSVGGYGNSTSTGLFSHPWSIAYDSSSAGPRLLVADTRNSRIVALDPSDGHWLGVLSKISKGTLPGMVRDPEGIAVSPTGSIWIADTGNNRVEEFNSDGTFANEMVGGYGVSNTEFNAPQGIEIGPDGLLYVGDAGNNRVQVFQPV